MACGWCQPSAMIQAPAGRQNTGGKAGMGVVVGLVNINMVRGNGQVRRRMVSQWIKGA